MIFSIDPGNVESAYVLMEDDYTPFSFGKVGNEELRDYIQGWNVEQFVIEMVASYGMPVGQEVFDTCVWIGIFEETARRTGMIAKKIFRKDVKMNLCGQTRAKDSNVRQALLDRFGVVGTKKNPGWFYGFKADVWQAYALAVTYLDLLKEGEKG